MFVNTNSVMVLPPLFCSANILAVFYTFVVTCGGQHNFSPPPRARVRIGIEDAQTTFTYI